MSPCAECGQADEFDFNLDRICHGPPNKAHLHFTEKVLKHIFTYKTVEDPEEFIEGLTQEACDYVSSGWCAKIEE